MASPEIKIISDPNSLIGANIGDYFYRVGEIQYIISGTDGKMTRISIPSSYFRRSLLYPQFNGLPFVYKYQKELWVKNSGATDKLGWTFLGDKYFEFNNEIEIAIFPSPTPSSTPTSTPAPSTTQTPTPTQTPTNTPTVTPTTTPTPTPLPAMPSGSDNMESYSLGNISALTDTSNWVGYSGSLGLWLNLIVGSDNLESYPTGGISSLTYITTWDINTGSIGIWSPYLTMSRDNMESYSVGPITSLSDISDWSLHTGSLGNW